MNLPPRLQASISLCSVLLSCPLTGVAPKSASQYLLCVDRSTCVMSIFYFRETWKNALCRFFRFLSNKIWKPLHSESLFPVYWCWTYSHKKWEVLWAIEHSEFSEWLNSKLLGTGVSIIVMYWGRFSVQWSILLWTSNGKQKLLSC